MAVHVYVIPTGPTVQVYYLSTMEAIAAAAPSSLNKIMGPHVLNILLKRVNVIIRLQEDHERAAREIDIIMDRPFDSEFFTADTIDKMKIHMEQAILCLWCDTASQALVLMKCVRALLDTIFVRNLWLANRLFINESTNRLFINDCDIGTLDSLPDLVKLELHKILYDAL